MNCPQCLVVILPTDRFCEECGTPLVADAQPMSGTKVCGKCGATDIDGDGYCVSCGFRNRDAAQDRFAVERSPYLAGVCDRGLKHHRNEDFLALETIESPSTQILVVCDGVSSSQTPELASQTVAQTTCEFLGDRLTRSDGQGKNNEEVMQQAIAAALKAVSTIPYKAGANVDPPSTTIVAAIVQEREATIGWLGDSRAYWIAADASRQLTVDDSWLNDVVASGKMSEVQALQSPHAHAITSWLGADVSDNAKPSILNFPIPSEGYLLLCTDGLWNYVPEASQIFALMQQSPSNEAAIISRYLVDFARSQGGHDNITVAVLYFT
ncbi:MULTISPECIES: PP2C family serine/threonine-protein phosphatase [Pseudanabaena]|uniref:Protein serine/threonine phosphatase n=2 Tax=Pseudanabaena TaxID=1152 RepID=L8N2Y1_9CYAN|nr:MULTISPECIES: PP2C family serine/threonine-protein phosphatase [Pseudanabaena]ELS33424.1 protein serine/threonine phosphatase [Pseudanabaena biceps PCC 7429]MDG3494362.1 protein phosphatase 2C domain-containing protein [Pseudanabaena catenata USMAC16]